MTTPIHFIAETDDQNAIAAVWYKPVTLRAPKLWQGPRDGLPAENAVFSGAPGPEIAKWLQERAIAAE